MNITIATGLYPPEIGGPATYAAMLETELPAYGFSLKVVPFGWVRHYPKVVRHIVYAYKLWEESKDADIIYALDPISVGFPASIVARLRRKNFWIRLGGDYAWEQGRVRFGVTDLLDEYLKKQDEQPFLVRTLAKLQAHVVSRAEKVIVPSKYLKGVVEAWGIEPDKITVIYSALHSLTISGSREQLRAQLSFTGPTIVSSGRLVPWKGFDVLIKVVAKLKERYPKLALVIVGDGEERESLEALAKKLKIENEVRFTGRVSKDALGAVMRAADAFVLNTAYEGLSHQLLEVMEMGTPIVTTRAGGNPELITDGVTGLLVSYNDESAIYEAVVRLLDHPETRERLAQSARAHSKQFAKEKVIKKLVELLEQQN